MAKPNSTIVAAAPSSAQTGGKRKRGEDIKKVASTAEAGSSALGDTSSTAKKSKANEGTAKVDKVKVRRVHVSGLPIIAEQEIKDRFKSFGEVVNVDGLGKLDGNGYPLRYAFLDIKTTKSKLSQCMNLLNGSVWKGATLRLADAKEPKKAKLDQERAEAAKQPLEPTKVVEQLSVQGAITESADKSGSKKRKRRADGFEGDMSSLVDASNVKSKRGWKMDPVTAAPIFPIIARPDHPLPALPEAKAPELSKRAQKKAEFAAAKAAERASQAGVAAGAEQSNKQKKKEKEKEKKKAREEMQKEPPTRARRVTIDSTKWKPTHLREDQLEKAAKNGPVLQTRPLQSELVESEGATSASSSEDESSSGSEEEEASVASSSVRSRSASPASYQAGSTAHPALSAYDSDAAEVERKAHLALVAQLVGGKAVEADAPVKDVVYAESEDEDEAEESEEGDNEGESDDEDEEEEAGVREKAAETAEAKQELLAQDASVALPTLDSSVESEGDDDASEEASSDEEEEAPQEEVAQKSQPDAQAEEQDESDAASDSTSPTLAEPSPSSGEDSDSGSEEENDDVDLTTNDGVKSAVQMGSLTEMFRPQEVEGGFSLGNLLDEYELEELDEEPAMPSHSTYTATPQTTTSEPYFRPAPSSGTAQHRHAERSAGYDPMEPLFFPYPMEGDDEPGGLVYSVSAEEKAKLLDRSWTGIYDARRFKRMQTVDEITSQYEAARRVLNEQTRKRHREAGRRRKKIGGRAYASKE